MHMTVFSVAAWTKPRKTFLPLMVHPEPLSSRPHRRSFRYLASPAPPLRTSSIPSKGSCQRHRARTLRPPRTCGNLYRKAPSSKTLVNTLPFLKPLVGGKLHLKPPSKRSLTLWCRNDVSGLHPLTLDILSNTYINWFMVNLLHLKPF